MALDLKIMSLNFIQDAKDYLNPVPTLNLTLAVRKMTMWETAFGSWQLGSDHLWGLEQEKKILNGDY